MDGMDKAMDDGEDKGITGLKQKNDYWKRVKKSAMAFEIELTATKNYE